MKGNVDLTEDRKFMHNPDKKQAKREWNSEEARRPKYESTTSTNSISDQWAPNDMDQTVATFSTGTGVLTWSSGNSIDSSAGNYISNDPIVNFNGKHIGLRDLVSGGRQSPFPWAPKVLYDWMLNGIRNKFEPILLGSKEDRKYKKFNNQYQEENSCKTCGKTLITWERKGYCSKCVKLIEERSQVVALGGWYSISAHQRFISFKEKPQRYFKSFNDKPSIRYSSSFRRRRNMMDMEVV